MAALDLLKKRSFDLILSDLKGIKVLDRSQRRPLSTPIVHLKSSDDPLLKDIAHVLEKPLNPQGVSTLLLNLLYRQSSKIHVIAQSPAMRDILRQVEKIAKSHSNVFICGESGTGKEVIAGLIHEGSRRSSHPFIRVNCAALPDTLIESEFFGHETRSYF